MNIPDIKRALDHYEKNPKSDAAVSRVWELHETTLVEHNALVAKNSVAPSEGAEQDVFPTKIENDTWRRLRALNEKSKGFKFVSR